MKPLPLPMCLIILGVACSSETRSRDATGDGVVVTDAAVTDPGDCEGTCPVKAFPTAQGHGTWTPAGRGGRIIEVTNLDDAGPGSFRDAVERPGPRIIVFRVGPTGGAVNRWRG